MYRVLRPLITAPRRLFSTTPALPLDQRWRASRRLPPNPTSRGPLTDGADYSYLDGRLTPGGVGQAQRFVEQKKNLERIVTLSQEVDFAVSRHQEMGAAEEERRRRRTGAKLKGRRDETKD